MPEKLTALDMARNCVVHVAAAAEFVAEGDTDPEKRLLARVHRVGEKADQDSKVAARMALVSIAEDLHRMAAGQTVARLDPAAALDPVAARVLETLDTEVAAPTAEIARALSLDVGTVLRCLGELAGAGLVKRFDTGWRATSPADPAARITKAMNLISHYGRTAGDHHKTWLIRQIAEALTGNGMGLPEGTAP
jgi:hypothetical protein